MNKSVINSYRLQPGPTPTTGTIAGRIVPLAAPASYRRAVIILAALLLPLLAVGVVVYAAQVTRPASAAMPTVTPAAEVTPVTVERGVEATAPPVVVIVTPTPLSAPVQVAPIAPQIAPPVQPAPRNPSPVQAQPTARKPPPAQAAPQVQRPAASAPIPTPTPGPQERLLSRGCEYRRQTYPQGTIIRGYYTDAQGVKRDAVCRADGWKAVD